MPISREEWPAAGRPTHNVGHPTALIRLRENESPQTGQSRTGGALPNRDGADAEGDIRNFVARFYNEQRQGDLDRQRPLDPQMLS